MNLHNKILLMLWLFQKETLKLQVDTQTICIGTLKKLKKKFIFYIIMKTIGNISNRLRYIIHL